MKIILALLVAVSVSGCSGLFENKPSPAAAVFAAKNGYLAALIVAVRYNETPRCQTPPAQPCSRPDVVAVLRQASNVTRESLDMAESVVRDAAFNDATKAKSADTATAALASMEAIITTYVPKEAK